MGLYEEIRDIIAKELAVEEDEVVGDAHLQDDLGSDSLGLLNIAEALCKAYGIDIGGDDLVDLENVDGLVSLVESKKGS
jgi:acyl carrier protein